MATKTKLEFAPISPVVGAVASAIDLSQPLDAEEVAAIREAVLKHGAVFFRDQDITQADTVAVPQDISGQLCTDPFVQGIEFRDIPEELHRPRHADLRQRPVDRGVAHGFDAWRGARRFPDAEGARIAAVGRQRHLLGLACMRLTKPCPNRCGT